ncbi:MAG: MraY family glycosyltransferase [Thermodesulforhabdaceae bacterium]
MLIIILVIAFLVSWGLVFVITPLVEKLARKTRLFDLPSVRKIHAEPTPRIGGLAFFFAIFIPFVVFYFGMCLYLELPFTYLLSKPDWLWVLLGATFIFITGLFDDLVGVSSGLKLLCQCVSSFAIISGGLGIEKVLIHPWGIMSLHPALSIMVTVLWFLVMINGFNFIDGLDGLAAGTAFICGLFLLIVAFQTEHYYMTIPIIMLAGATIGFLHYNFNPARIFMGDSGSYFLGYALAAIAVKVSRDETIGGANVIVPVAVILSIPAIDVLVAALRRALRKNHIFKPDCEHIHHCMIQKGFSHSKTVFWLYGANCLMGLLGISYFYLPPPFFWTILFGTVVLLFLLASTFGYLDWLLKSNFVVFLKTKLVKARFRVSFLRDLWWLENASTIEEMRKRLVSILVQLNFDYARLTIFSPPIDEKSHQREVVYPVLKSGSKILQVSAPLQLNIPLIRGKTVYGYLFVERNIMETALPQKWLLNLVERIARSALNWIIRNRSKGSRSAFASKSDVHEKNVRRETFILIAKPPYATLNQPH